MDVEVERMKHSAYCEWCGYETALVEDEEDVDWDLLDIHQEFCKGVEEAKKKGIFVEWADEEL